MARGKRKGPIYHGQPTRLVPSSARRALASGVALFLVLVVAGIAYTFFSDSQASPKAAAQSSVLSADSIQPIRPVKPAANAPVGAAVEAFSSLVTLGSDASISVRTLPGSKCKIEVLYNKIPAVDPGLSPKIADDFGTVSWDWTVGPDTLPGMWPVNVTCARHGRMGFVQATLDVSPS